MAFVDNNSPLDFSDSDSQPLPNEAHSVESTIYEHNCTQQQYGLLIIIIIIYAYQIKLIYHLRSEEILINNRCLICVFQQSPRIAKLFVALLYIPLSLILNICYYVRLYTDLLLDWIHAPAQVPEPNQFDLTQVVTVPNVQTDLSLIDIDNTDNV